MNRVLIAGGTGRLGTLLATALAEGGTDVRVLTRDPRRAMHLSCAQIEIVTGDVRDPVSTIAAVAGMNVVVSAVHGFAGPGGGSPASVDRDGNIKLIDAARAAGADMVLLSTVGAAPDSPYELFRMKYAAERYLQASPVPGTIVRATAFLELWIDLLSRTAGKANRPLVFGRGTNPINFVLVSDVAALVARVITEPSTRGRILEIAGPDNLSLNDLARMIAAQRGVTTNPRHLPRGALRAISATVGRLRPELGRQTKSALNMDRYPMAHDPGTARDAYTDLPLTTARTVLAC